MDYSELPSLVIAFTTAIAAGAAAVFAGKAAKAFIAVEDASLIVEFEEGKIGHSTPADGETGKYYSFFFSITNVGRSTARLYGYNLEGQKPVRDEKTLKPNETYTPRRPIDVENPGKYFVLLVHYGSPLSPSLYAKVTSTFKERTAAIGVNDRVIARVKTTRKNRGNEG